MSRRSALRATLAARFPTGTTNRYMDAETRLAVEVEREIARAAAPGALEAYPGDWEPDGTGPALTCPTHLKPIGECLPCLLAGEEQRL